MGDGIDDNPKKSTTHIIGNVEGKGFKDKATALKTLQILKGRDPLYQYRSILTLKTSCRSALRRVKNPQKKKNLEEALEVFHKWIANYRKKDLGSQTNLYIPVSTLERFMPLLNHYNIENEFLDVYIKKCKGDHKRLREIKGEKYDKTWDIVRNAEIKKLKKQSEENEERLWTEDMIPSEIHAKMISWAYSPDKEIRLRCQQELFEKIDAIILK
ncbi:uncharacterized protein LOC123305784 [Chrysoperla carnea]|uniref:uncharacterized protein LOC123305784 n=1 Tax=Chrysoperla carnea TaxID=189513 RepID=UPI001D07535A|nr:uncharacterized protein LOC123305784 [Chrysoperla carnea]